MFSLLARLDERYADDLFPEWVPVWLPPLLWLLTSIVLMIAGLIMMQREKK